MYPKNNSSPERVAVGQVILIADGTIQTASVSIVIRGQGGAEGAGGGTTAYGADGTVYYTPTQAETNYTSFVIIAYKASCFSASQTIITTQSATAGQVRLEGVTHTSAVVPTVSTVTNAIALPTIPTNWITATGINAAALNGKGDWNIGKTGYSLTQTFPANFSDLAIEVTTGKVNTKTADTVTDGAKSATALSTADWTATRAGYLDTSILSRNAVTPPSAAAITADILSASQNSYTASGTIGRSIQLAGAILVDTTITGTPTSTTMELNVGSAIDNFYKDQLVFITSGTGAGQVRYISSYVGATKTITVDEAYTATPTATDKIVVQSTHVFSKADIASAVTSDLDANSTQLTSLVTSALDIKGTGFVKDTHSLTNILASSDALGITKNQTFLDMPILMVDATDFATPETGVVVTGTRSIDGAAFAALDAGSVITEVGSGIYSVDLAAVDTNGNSIIYKFIGTGCADTFMPIKTRT